MEKTVCPYCNKKLVTPFSCRRHIELTHSRDHIAAMKNACDLLGQSDAEEEEEDSSDGEEGEEEEDKEEEENDADADNELDDHDPWMAVLEGALGKLKEDGKMDNTDEMLYEPKFSILMEALRAEVIDVVEKCMNLKNTPIHKALRQTHSEYVKDGMDVPEAGEAAWDKRKHLIKLFLRKNMDEIVEVWNELD